MPTVKQTGIKIMKKLLVIAAASFLFLFSCKKSDLLLEAKPAASESLVSAKATRPDITCQTYSIFNPHGPSGATVLYTYIDCDGISQSGSLDPLQTITVKAQPGTVKCAGGVVKLI